MDVYYNEWEPFAAAWIRELIKACQLPQGTVDERDIRDVQPRNVVGRTAHWFAGIGGWPYALRLAGWPESEQVWTASLACQPFSQAGKRKGTEDERHLWPVFFELVRSLMPPTLFGEQVGGTLGREWLSRVHIDLASLGYQFGAADLCAASVGAPHGRARLFWVASLGNSNQARLAKRQGNREDNDAQFSATQRTGGVWDRYDIAARRHFKGGRIYSRIEPWTYPMANGVPERVGCLCGYGNAIVPQVAATFIRAFVESVREGVSR